LSWGYDGRLTRDRHGAGVGERSSNLGAGGRDERRQQVLTPVLVLDQLSPICGMMYRTDRFERRWRTNQRLMTPRRSSVIAPAKPL
jgi:hypothetical protein